MKKKILIVGKNSFISSNISIYLKNFFFIYVISFKQFKNISKKNLIKFNYIINCSISKKYTINKYKEFDDIDLYIANKIKNTSLKLIFLSTRKIYKIGKNLKEYSKILPKCNYSKNKYITEKKIRKILPNKVLILRISNIIGKYNQKKISRKIHKTFIDNFFINIKKNIIFDNKNIFKDFLTIKKFCEIIRKLILIDAHGTFNVSLGKRVYLRNLIEWLNYYNENNIVVKKLPKNFNKDCFYLNNSKLKNKIKINFADSELKNYCYKISKNFFRKSKFNY